MGRAPCCDKANVKKGPWSPEEDAKLKSYIENHGTGGNWIALPQKIGMKRCGKSCRLRWLNYLRPNIKHGGFTEEEESIICSLYTNIGSRWSVIAAQLPGRTDNDIKNYWNTRLKKKLMAKQRKQHQAVSRAGIVEHELMKREISDSFLVHHTPTYCAQDDSHLRNQDQMNKVLMNKLEGQFYQDPQILVNSSRISYQYNPIQEQSYVQLSKIEDKARGTGFLTNTTSTLPADIEAYLNNLMSLEGSTSYSGGGVDGGDSTSTPSSVSVGTTSWGEMNSLAANTPISDFDAYNQHPKG